MKENRISHPWQWLFCLAVLLLSGCGGGSSTGSASASATTDTTGPSVSATAPADNATDVTPMPTITARFGEALLASSVNAASVTLRENGGAAVGSTLSFDGATNTVSLQPNTPLKLLTTYVATATTAIADAAGNRMAANHQWRFTTRDGSWKTAQLVESDNAGSVETFDVAFDVSGNAMAVWAQYDGARFNIWANRYIAGAGWDTPQLVETDSAGSAYDPQVAFDPNGNALAVWNQHDGTRGNIYANRYTAGAGWGAAQLIESNNAGHATTPQIAFDAGGNALAVWNQVDGTRWAVWANRYTAGAGWGTAQLIDNTAIGDANAPQIAVDASGNALAVWEQVSGARHDIWANRYTAGAGWGTAALIETDNAGPARYPQIAIVRTGNALAVWSQGDGVRAKIYSNLYTVGSGWGTPQSVETDNSDAENPQIAIDAGGNALAVWEQWDGTSYNVWANRYTVGAGWGTAQSIETGDSPRVAVDAGGNALVVWTQSDDTRQNVRASRYTLGAGWGTPQVIETENAGGAFLPQVAIDGSGRALAVWGQSDGTRASLLSNRFD